MDQPHSDPPAGPGSGFSLLRPAVPPRAADAPVGRGTTERSLGPFSPVHRHADQERKPEPEPEGPAEPASEGATGLEELPWALLDAPLWDDEPVADAAGSPPERASTSATAESHHVAEEMTLDDESEWLEYEASADAPIAEDALVPLADASDPGGEPLMGEELLAPPEWEYGFDGAVAADAAARAEPQAAGATEASSTESSAPVPAAGLAADGGTPASGPRSRAIEEVAARLETIARALRGQSPAELLAGSSDPLQLLIAGYALGLEAARADRERAGGGS